ncbi:MAG: channel protein TolC, partial [Betaproteobacteria bacterium]|nr:channel protein TolC [Betaproteobacteria bacterium]
YQSAKAQMDATIYKTDQAIAGILPTVTSTAGASRSNIVGLSDAWMGTSTSATTLVPATTYDRIFGTQNASITASQALYRPANVAAYVQGKRQREQAYAVLASAEQDLMVRLSQAYFDVLASQDSLTFVQAQKIAVNEQLASAKRNFEVGTATITDTREAQARYDLVIAQEIAAENDLRVKRMALDMLVGKKDVSPKPLVNTNDLPPAPVNMDEWVSQSERVHPAIQKALLDWEVAKLEVDKAKALHKPTVDLQASYSYSLNLDGTATSGSGLTTTGLTYIGVQNSHVGISSIGVLVTLPIFTGFSADNRIKETLKLEDKAQADLEVAKRNVAQATRAAYFGVVSGLGQVNALKAAEDSSQLALDANKLGYSVGVRINIDVLNSQSQLYQTKRDLAKARY